MDKYRKKEVRYFLYILPVPVGIIISLIIQNVLVGICGILYLLMVGCYYEIQQHMHPYKENPDEIRELKEKLENDDIIEFIKDGFVKKGMTIYKISRKLDEKYNIELLIPRGHKFGNFKSEELIEKMLEILGIKTEAEYGRAHYYHKRKKPIKFEY